MQMMCYIYPDNIFYITIRYLIFNSEDYHLLLLLLLVVVLVVLVVVAVAVVVVVVKEHIKYTTYNIYVIQHIFFYR